MDAIKREELEKACKKIYNVHTNMVAVCIVCVFNMSMDETASIQARCPTWIRGWLRRYDEGCLRDLPRWCLISGLSHSSLP